MPSPIPLSIQDLAPVSEGHSTQEALARTVELAQCGERLGYERVWYAEHHGMANIASSSPEILIANTASRTKTIRVGAGGVMLPNHVPLRVAETYRTLAGLNPGRIDLGIGRAGGSDGRTLQALRSFGGEHFSEQLAELLAFETGGFAPEHPFSKVGVVPDEIALPPIWLLGSSGASAEAAGTLGVGYAFAAHFSHTPAAPALGAYRAAFRPTPHFPKPHAILCVAAMCAPTDAEAQFLSGSMALTWVRMHRGETARISPPEVAATFPYTERDLAVIETQRPLWIVGSPQRVRDRILAMVAETGADEVMISTAMWDYAKRLDNYRLIAEAFGLEPRA